MTDFVVIWAWVATGISTTVLAAICFAVLGDERDHGLGDWAALGYIILYVSAIIAGIVYWSGGPV